MTAQHKSAAAPLVVKSDLVTATALILCAALACLPDRARQSALCRSIARKHIGLRGSRAATLETILPLLADKISAAELEVALLADEYEAVAETWRHYLPRHRPLVGRLQGRAPLEAALKGGGGAILWHCANGLGRTVALRCLAEDGYPVVALRGPGHPFSRSRFCRMFMNPIPNRVDNRYLDSVIMVSDGNSAGPLADIADALAANRLVLAAAGGAFGEPWEMPFMGGTLRLGLGVPALALKHGAPLIPLFSIADGQGGFEVTAGDRLAGDTPGALAESYAALLADRLKHHPRLWESWLTGDVWIPPQSGRQ